MTTTTKKKSQNPLDYDPTRTTMLRRQFGAALQARLDRISRRITQVIEREDAFGLKPTLNIFCPTGTGGGVDPTCGKGGVKRTIVGSKVSAKALAAAKKIQAELPADEKSALDGWLMSAQGIRDEERGTLHPGRKPTAERFKRALDKLPTHQGEVVRGVDRLRSEPVLGEVQTIGASTSYTANPKTAARFGTKYGFVLQTKTAAVLHGSNAQEVVVRKGSQYKVVDIQERVEVGSKKFGKVFFMEEVGPTTNRLRLIFNARWQFKTTPEQVQAFEEWIQQELGDALLNDNGSDAYWEEFIRRGYEQGAGRAFDDAKIKGGNKNLDFYRGKKSQFLQSAFGQPVSKERVQLLAGRTFTDLKGFTQAMATQMSRQLVDGLVKGESPRTVARRLTSIVQGNKSRALTIARTETIRAHAEGQLDALEMMGVTQIGVAVEWSTAKFNVCPLCVPLEGVVFSVKEARGMLPRHPNCRCAFLPANVGETGEAQQKKTKSSKQAAIDESIKEEIPEKSKRTLKEQKKRTSWSGADLKPEDAPKSILDD